MKQLTVGVFTTTAVFLQNFLTFMIVKALGMVLDPARDQFITKTWMLGSIFGAVESVADVLSPISIPLAKKFGDRPVVMFGGVLVTIGMIMSSFAPDITTLALALDFVVACGMGLSKPLTRAALGKHFTNQKFALATGISEIGSCLSLIAMPTLIQLCIMIYGWRGTLLILGGISGHFIVSGAILLKCNTDSTVMYQSVCSNEHHSVVEQDAPKEKATKKSFSLTLSQMFDLKLMKRFHFWLVAFIYVITRIIQGAWLIYFVPQTTAKGFTGMESGLLVTAAGFGFLVGALLVSVALYKGMMTSGTALIIATVFMSASLCVDPWTTSGWQVTVEATIFMGAEGVIFLLADVLVKEYFDDESLSGAFGWVAFSSGTVRVLGGFFPGWLYDSTGSYDLAFFILGLLQATILIPLVLDKLYFQRKRSDFR